MDQLNYTGELQNHEFKIGSSLDEKCEGDSSLNSRSLSQHCVCVSPTWEKTQLPSSDF